MREFANRDFVTKDVLLLDVGRWIGRLEQVRVAFCGKEEDGKVHGQEPRRR